MMVTMEVTVKEKDTVVMVFILSTDIVDFIF